MSVEEIEYGLVKRGLEVHATLVDAGRMVTDLHAIQARVALSALFTAMGKACLRSLSLLLQRVAHATQLGVVEDHDQVTLRRARRLVASVDGGEDWHPLAVAQVHSELHSDNVEQRERDGAVVRTLFLPLETKDLPRMIVGEEEEGGEGEGGMWRSMWGDDFSAVWEDVAESPDRRPTDVEREEEIRLFESLEVAERVLGWVGEPCGEAMREMKRMVSAIAGPLDDDDPLDFRDGSDPNHAIPREFPADNERLSWWVLARVAVSREEEAAACDRGYWTVSTMRAISPQLVILTERTPSSSSSPPSSSSRSLLPPSSRPKSLSPTAQHAKLVSRFDHGAQLDDLLTQTFHALDNALSLPL